MSLSASLRPPLLSASHLCPSLCLLLLLLHLRCFISLTLLSPTSLTLSLPSLFNVLFKWLGHGRQTKIERGGKWAVNERGEREQTMGKWGEKEKVGAIKMAETEGEV